MHSIKCAFKLLRIHLPTDIFVPQDLHVLYIDMYPAINLSAYAFTRKVIQFPAYKSALTVIRRSFAGKFHRLPMGL